MIHERVSRIRLRADAIGVVSTHVDDRDVRAGERFFQTLVTLLRVGCVENADEDHDLAAVRQSLFDQLTCLASRFDVIRADVTDAIAVWRVAVLRDNERLARGAIQHRCLVGGIDGADGDALNAFREQIVNDALLLGGSAVRRNPELHLDAGNVLRCFLSSFARDNPEVGGIVGHESEFVLGSGAASGGVSA
jgi:hypothetical protein